MSDEPFDIFGADKQPRERSAREKEHDEQISYKKYSGAVKFPCWDCVTEQTNLRTATVVRREKGHDRYLCTRHAQGRRDQEALVELARKDSGKRQANAKRRRS